MIIYYHTQFGKKKKMGEEFRRYWADAIWHKEKISSRQTFTDILNLRCDLDLQRSSPIFQKNTLAYDAVLSKKIWLQTNQQFRRYSRNNHILIIKALTVTLTLNTVNQFFCTALWLMMLYNHTKFGNKMFCGSEDIIQTVINISNLQCDLDLECRNPNFPQDTPAYDAVLRNQVWLQMGPQFRRYSKNSHILII